MVNKEEISNKERQQQQLLKYAEWQKVDDYVVYRATGQEEDEYEYEGTYYIMDLQTHSIISTLEGPHKHGREIVDPYDIEQMCISCSNCYPGVMSEGDACLAYRKPKPGVSEQELSDMCDEATRKGSSELHQKVWRENTVIELCPHAEALVTVLKRKHNIMMGGGAVEEEGGEYTCGWVSTLVVNRRRRRPQQEKQELKA